MDFRDLNDLPDDGQLNLQHVPADFQLSYWTNQFQSNRKTSSDQTCYGYIHSGQGRLIFDNRRFDVCSGMYFCIDGPFCIEGKCNGIAMSKKAGKGLFQIGGPVEANGRLNYIDGCSDTLLVSPLRIGMPCINHLHIPPNTEQRFHTHPSFRFGIILRGSGECDFQSGSHPLHSGIIFHIPEEGLHRFRTRDQSLDVIAFHPDSDFGPSDTNHPMVNKTIVKGISAAKLSFAERAIAPKKSGAEDGGNLKGLCQ